ncbi:MAG: hypothetical protein SPL05_02690 [Eubacteriales bacterium]|nr:hypothetical protein [Eubacteriales bacterium]
MEQDGDNIPVDSIVPAEVQKALDALKTVRGKTILAYLSSISMIAPISPQLEMVKKIESEHISKIIDLDAHRLKHGEEMDKRLFENAQKIRQHELIYAIVLGILY